MLNCLDAHSLQVTYSLTNSLTFQGLSHSTTPVVRTIILLVLWIIFGSLYLHFSEDWTLIQSFYWSVMTFFVSLASAILSS
jgi:hypothetical protein